MKNIYIIETNKLSKLCIDNSCNELNYSEIQGLSSKHITNQHIYITSDEEIKNGDYIFDVSEMTVYKCIGQGVSGYKIILTTDPELISNGIQAIDDDFLEWFVNNTNYEEVEFERIKDPTDRAWYHTVVCRRIYKIIIPKEEPKQGINIKEFEQKANEIIDDVGIEEAALRLYPHVNDNTRLLFINGAKWQQEKMYSEEEAKKLIVDFLFTKGIGREVGSVNE